MRPCIRRLGGRGRCAIAISRPGKLLLRKQEAVAAATAVEEVAAATVVEEVAAVAAVAANRGEDGGGDPKKRLHLSSPYSNRRNPYKYRQYIGSNKQSALAVSLPQLDV